MTILVLAAAVATVGLIVWRVWDRIARAIDAPPTEQDETYSRIDEELDRRAADELRVRRQAEILIEETESFLQLESPR